MEGAQKKNLANEKNEDVVCFQEGSKKKCLFDVFFWAISFFGQCSSRGIRGLFKVIFTYVPWYLSPFFTIRGE